MQTDPYVYARGRIEAMRPRMAWSEAPVKGPARWAVDLRAELAGMLGAQQEPIPARVPFRVVEEVRGEAHRLIQFESRPGWGVLAHLLTPESPNGAAVVALHGHGQGADAIVGLKEEPYHGNFALPLVERGYTVLAIEQASFGRRKSAQAVGKDYSCPMDSALALALGETMIGWRVRDARVGVSLVAGLPGVDGGRIATMGISGGGTTALWSAAMDDRIAATCVSGYFCTFAESIFAVDHCFDNYVPGIARLIDMPDLAGLVAPRCLFVESGTEDPIFSLKGFREACEKARAIYEHAGVPERFRSYEFEGDHHWHGEGLYAALDEAFAR